MADRPNAGSTGALFTKSYKLLFTKDSVQSPKAIIYESDVATYWKIQLRDSIFGETVKKPIKLSFFNHISYEID